MDNYIAHANIDHYLELLDEDNIPPAKRSMITRLLIEEENKLSRDLEQLQFAESRAAACRDRLSRLKRLRDSFADSADRLRADGMVQTFEAILTEMENFCSLMRKRVESSGL